MRSLWTAASGMISQQMNVDTIANNLSNVNTSGYKKERVEFKSLLYDTMVKANIDENGQGKPVNLQVGHGVKPVATSKSFTQGNVERTENQFDFALDGRGFFAIEGRNEEELYTRDGNFKISLVDGDLMLVTSEGDPVYSTDDEPVLIPGDLDMSRVSISDDGRFQYTNEDKEVEDLGIQLKIVQFSNPQALEARGGNLFSTTAATGEPLVEADEPDLNQSRIMQGYIESSNVQVVEEMVKMIVAQRAYEINTKAIQTSDEMLSQANQLKR